MLNRPHDAAFAQFVADRRPLLLTVAFLMFGELNRAEDVIQAALARLYGAWP
ncbi:MAG: hypothetical protein QOF35_1219, partial [Actinomycetota bacterium]|nr:hypothetical protein [Actinomycetota bacterium]